MKVVIEWELLDDEGRERVRNAVLKEETVAEQHAQMAAWAEQHWKEIWEKEDAHASA